MLSQNLLLFQGLFLHIMALQESHLMYSKPDQTQFYFDCSLGYLVSWSSQSFCYPCSHCYCLDLNILPQVVLTVRAWLSLHRCRSLQLRFKLSLLLVLRLLPSGLTVLWYFVLILCTQTFLWLLVVSYYIFINITEVFIRDIAIAVCMFWLFLKVDLKFIGVTWRCVVVLRRHTIATRTSGHLISCVS